MLHCALNSHPTELTNGVCDSEWSPNQTILNVPDKPIKNRPVVPNEISDDTGQYDMRFLLWRMFCAENGLPVSTMPSDLEGALSDKWETLKEERLRKKRKS